MSTNIVTRSRSLLVLALTGLTAGCNAAYGYDREPAPQPPVQSEQPGAVDGRQGAQVAYRQTSPDRGRRFSVDMVADCNRFTSGGIGHPGANPRYGDYFMQEGLMYRPGTLAKHCQDGDGCGLNPDGSAEFPEDVIGKWTCFGSFVGNGAATAEGTWIYSTQVYEFAAEKLAANVFAPGRHAIVSIGPERNDLDTPWPRAISGGYGRYRSAQGEVVQTKVGFNQTTCENFTVDFELDSRR
jgi:hypothetical protein